jgi:hypothetical protein
MQKQLVASSSLTSWLTPDGRGAGKFFLYCRHVSLWHRQRATWLLANHASFGPYPLSQQLIIGIEIYMVELPLF